MSLTTPSSKSDSMLAASGGPVLVGRLFRRWLAAAAAVMVAAAIVLKAAFLPDAVQALALCVFALTPFAFVCGAGWSIMRAVRDALRRLGGACGRCAYPLPPGPAGKGELARRCPECGAVSPGDSILRQRWAQLGWLFKPRAYRRFSARALRQQRTVLASRTETRAFV